MWDKKKKKKPLNRGHFPYRLVTESIPATESMFRFKVFFREFIYQPSDDGYDAFFGQVVVPIGFKTDFASVPWAFRLFIPKSGRYNEAAVIHDYLCYLWKKHNFGIEYRQEADNLFYEMMEVLGVKKTKRKFMWLGVGLYTKALKWKLIRLKKNEY
jgi:hypothetical protein